MRLDLRPPVVQVTLSRRNVLSLLAKLGQPGSVCTILSSNVYGPDGGEIDQIELVVRVEPDAEHYAAREPAGLMHPVTEEIVRRMVDVLDGPG